VFFLLRNTRWTLGQTTSDAKPASDACSVVRRNSTCVSERLVLAQSNSDRVSMLCALDAGERPMVHHRTRPMSARKVSKPY